MPDDAVFTANRTQIVELALKNRLPVIYSNREFVSPGGLMSYGPNTKTYTGARRPTCDIVVNSVRRAQSRAME